MTYRLGAGVRQEEELPPRHQRKLFSDVAEAAAREAHVTVTLPSSGSDPVAHGERRGQGSPKGEPRNVDTQTLDEHGVYPGVPCNARASRTKGLKVRNPENLVGCVPSKGEGVAGDAVQREGDFELIWICRSRRNVVDETRGRGAVDSEHGRYCGGKSKPASRQM